ncbi:STXBP4 [Bugula neritina]|uniref:STXBP4 n=1 Tax=Bugula neritina TaxID=10212 RepID=A0A7J7IVP6_BUGNE|nr:STXBP4 [Bugula neritina]
MAAQPSQHNYNNITVLQSSHKLVEPTAFNGDHQSDLFDEIRQLQKENFTLRKQVHSLSRQLNEQVQLTCKAEKDLHRFRAESQETLQQTTSLKQKLLLAAESQKIARDQELELEGIIDGLKQENRILKENEAKQLESSLVRKKLAVLGSQLRKSEDSKKIYQVAVQKLLEYCQNVHDTMAGQSKSKLSAQNIAAEALETVNLVRALLERNPLPFGWEECFDENGARYFINHVTQETSWQHPVTRQTSSLADRIAD